MFFREAGCSPWVKMTEKIWTPAMPLSKLPLVLIEETIHEPGHNKSNIVVVRPAQTQISLGIRPV